MGWYIRKGFNLGPVRLNLSRSGLGVSFGFKGARLGFGPRRSYVHMGRGGLYYRQGLGTGQNNSDVFQPSTTESDNLKEIDSVDVSNFTDASSESILRELNRVKKYIEVFPIFLIHTILGFCCIYYFRAPQWAYYLASVVSVMLLVAARHFDVTNGTALLEYDLDSSANEDFRAVQKIFESIMSCFCIWHIEASGKQRDWKRNAGADQTVRRKVVLPKLSLPPRVQCNIKVPVFPAGKQAIYFFPDRIVVYAPNGVGAVAYKDFKIEVSKNRFIERDTVPKDSIVIDKTWEYVNKKGGPDRRFNNNRELPIVQYEEMHLKSSTGLNELFMLSKIGLGLEFLKSLKK